MGVINQIGVINANIINIIKERNDTAISDKITIYEMIVFELI